MDKMLGHSLRGKEKLVGEGSMAMRAKGKKAISSTSVAEMSEHSGDASEELMEWSKTLSTEEKGSHSCWEWVVDMEQMLEDTSPTVEMARWNQRSIYRVPEFMKKRTNSDAYRPLFVSLGPYHHGEPHLLPMEQHKRRAMLHMVKRAGKPLGEFVAAVEEMADELEAAYDDLDETWRGANRDRFVEMMVTDGCFLLEFLRIPEFLIYRNADPGYAANDPVFSERSFRTLWPIMRVDLIAMENQVPLVVLERLVAVELSTSPSAGDINFAVLHLLNGPYFDEGMDKLGLHFLDLYHKSYCGACPQWEGSDSYAIRTQSAVELSEAGIQFHKSNDRGIHDVDFQNGVLSMPLFKFDDSTEIIFLNLMAFEWLHADANRDVSFYICFMDKIIESETDVKLLRSKGLVVNLLGRDKKVVEMLNTLTKLSRVPIGRLGHVQWKLNAHCKKRRNKWRASFVSTYLSNPWVFVSLVAAVILLLATLLQTVYTMVPFYTKG
ncbi:UPF0481 protein [Dichanthelium oligosanthes]|uniref:UPF0481 protein n=1 Tax=Dichanthelium oligosanthes TaxID=888268 RepID=A0A1E5V7T8_9POAL|nr:UPF0481 protein [Dichanthelium oligosanthes]